MLDYLKIRRDLHQIPEIGLEEYKTHAYLMQVIDGLTAGLDFVEIRTWRTGILVFIKGSSPDKTIGWRTDIDGLPIVEDTGLDFASTHEGRMHACGHGYAHDGCSRPAGTSCERSAYPQSALSLSAC